MKLKALLAMLLCAAVFMTAGAGCGKTESEESSVPSVSEDNTFDFDTGNNAVGEGETSNESHVSSGNKGTNSQTDVDTTVDTDAPKLFPDRKNIKGEIKLFLPFDSSTDEWQDIFAQFKKKYPETKLTIITAQWASQNVKLAQQIVSGNAPDYIYTTIHDFPSRAIKNYVQSIDEYISVYPQGVSKYLMENVASWEGSKYAIIARRNPSVLYYNTTMFKNAGLETPFELWKKNKWDWAKMKEYAAEFTDSSKGIYGFGTDWEQNFLASAGTDIVKFDKNGKPSLNIDDPKFKEALLFYYDGINKDKIFSPTRWDNRKDFIDGKIAMFGGIFGDYSAMDAAGFKDYSIAPMPKYDDTNGYVGIAEGDGWSVGEGAKNPEGGMAFGEFQYNYYQKKAETDKSNQKFSKEIMAMVDTITNRVSFIDNYGMYDSFSQAFGNFMRKNGDFYALLEENRPVWNKCIKDVLDGK